MTTIADLADEARTRKASGQTTMPLVVIKPSGFRPRGTTTRAPGLGQVRIVRQIDLTRWLCEIGVDQVLDRVDSLSDARERRRKRA